MADLRDVIPGLRDAVDQEQLVRESAFLVETESVGGFELRPMTLRDYLALLVSRSPFMVGGDPGPQDIADFLWRLSPAFKPGDDCARRALQKRCEKFVPPKLPLLHTRRAMARWTKASVRCLEEAGAIITAICAYVGETMMDAATGSKSGYDPVYFGTGAGLCASFGREYGWPPSVTLGLPMKAIFQLLREHCHHQRSDTPMVNTLSDGVKRDFLEGTNRKRFEP